MHVVMHVCINEFMHVRFISAGCSGNGAAVALPDCGSRCSCSVRWTGTCCETRRPWRNWGDPHLETLDGKLFRIPLYYTNENHEIINK